MILLPLFPGIPGGIELLVILMVIVLLFGANKLPKLARASGQAMGEFRRGREEIEAELKAGVDDTTTTENDPLLEDEPVTTAR
jgi:sec-independent protein translocase protein TatA